MKSFQYSFIAVFAFISLTISVSAGELTKVCISKNHIDRGTPSSNRFKNRMILPKEANGSSFKNAIYLHKNSENQSFIQETCEKRKVTVSEKEKYFWNVKLDKIPRA